MRLTASTHHPLPSLLPQVAVKCLNPSLFFSGPDGGVSRGAVVDLLREADMLGALRHPNIVWVYG